MKRKNNTENKLQKNIINELFVKRRITGNESIVKNKSIISINIIEKKILNKEIYLLLSR